MGGTRSRRLSASQYLPQFVKTSNAALLKHVYRCTDPFMNSLARSSGAWLCAALIVFGVGCTANHYRRSADKDVYKAITQRTPMVPNMDTNFTIAQTNLPSLERLPVTTNAM